MAIDGMHGRFWESGGMIRFPLHNRMTLDGSDVTLADVRGGGSRSERVMADFLLFDGWVRFRSTVSWALPGRSDHALKQYFGAIKNERFFEDRGPKFYVLNHLADLARRWLRRKFLSIQPRKIKR